MTTDSLRIAAKIFDGQGHGAYGDCVRWAADEIERLQERVATLASQRDQINARLRETEDALHKFIQLAALEDS